MTKIGEKIEAIGNQEDVYNILKNKNYEVISSVQVKREKINYIGVAQNELIVCIIDEKDGDWLADEKTFQDEKPIWFSQNNHRVSPVYTLKLICDTLKIILKLAKMDFTIKPYMIIQSNVLNAEDMLDSWEKMNIDVTRGNVDQPEILIPFVEKLQENKNRIDNENFVKLKKILIG